MKLLVQAVLFTTQLSLILSSATLVQFQYHCLVTDSKCLTRHVQALVPTITAGLPQSGFERLDTMLIETIDVNRPELQYTLKDVHVQGLKNAIIDSFSVDPVSKVIRMVYHSDILVKSRYVGQGVLFEIPVAGEGDMTMRFENAQMEMVMPYEIIQDVHGRDILNLKGFDYSYDVKNCAEYNLSNLYYGDKHASDIMHQLINKNWKFVTIQYAKYVFDNMNSRIFNLFRSFMLSRSVHDVFAL